MKRKISNKGEALIGLQSDDLYGHEMLFDANGRLKKALFIAKGVAYVPVKNGDIFLTVKRKSFCDRKSGERGPCQIEVQNVTAVALDGKENFKLRDRERISLDIIPPHTWYGLGREKVDVSYLVARDNRFPLPKEAEKGKRLGKTIPCTTKFCSADSEISREGDICKFCLLCSGSGTNGWFCMGEFKYGEKDSLKMRFEWMSDSFLRQKESFEEVGEIDRYYTRWCDVITAHLTKIPDLKLFHDLVNLPIMDGEKISLNKPIPGIWEYGNSCLCLCGDEFIYKEIFKKDIENSPYFVYDETGLL